MAHDNVLFIVVRKFFEGNKADNKLNIPAKNQKNFPTLSCKDAVNELSKRHFHSKKFCRQPKPWKQQTQTTQRPRSDIYLKDIGQERLGSERNLD
jgi:hypothetical protein